MRTEPLRLALLIPLLGAGVPAAWLPAHAQEGFGVPAAAAAAPGPLGAEASWCADFAPATDGLAVPAPSVALAALGLDAGAPAASAPAGPLPEPTPVRRATVAALAAPPQIIWSFGLDDGTPIELVVPDTAAAAEAEAVATGEFVAEESVAEESVTEESVTEESVADESVAEQSVAEAATSTVVADATVLHPGDVEDALEIAPPDATAPTDLLVIAMRPLDEPAAPPPDPAPVPDATTPIPREPPAPRRTAEDLEPVAADPPTDAPDAASPSGPAVMASGVAPLVPLTAADEALDIAGPSPQVDWVLSTLEWVLAQGHDHGDAYALPEPASAEVDKVLDTLAEIRGARTEPQAFAAAVVSEDALDGVRGGFTADNGVHVSFGIERVVRINGEVVARPVFSVNGGSAQAVDLGRVIAVQNGSGNVLVTGPVPGQGAALVIQNSLDAQTIQTLTVINATTNSLQMLKGMQLQSNLTDAIAASLRR